jgi:hypothetical protein
VLKLENWNIHFLWSSSRFKWSSNLYGKNLNSVTAGNSFTYVAYGVPTNSKAICHVKTVKFILNIALFWEMSCAFFLHNSCPMNKSCITRTFKTHL